MNTPTFIVMGVRTNWSGIVILRIGGQLFSVAEIFMTLIEKFFVGQPYGDRLSYTGLGARVYFQWSGKEIGKRSIGDICGEDGVQKVLPQPTTHKN